MKKQVVILLLFALFSLSSFNQPLINKEEHGDKSVGLVEKWKLGISAGVLNDLSQKEFYELKSDGIECIELSSRIFTSMNKAESEALVLDIKRKADNAGIEIWSFHLPFSRVLDISTTKHDCFRKKC